MNVPLLSATWQRCVGRQNSAPLPHIHLYWATHCLLVNTAAALDIPCKLQKRLPAIDDALESLTNFMGGMA